jgi:hypothetical protein
VQHATDASEVFVAPTAPNEAVASEALSTAAVHAEHPDIKEQHTSTVGNDTRAQDDALHKLPGASLDTICCCGQ